MTNKEALFATLDGLSFSDLTLEKALADQQLDAATLYAPEQSKGVDLAAVELLLIAYTKPDVSEGDLSISHPDFLRKVQARLLYLARKHSLTAILEQFDPKPKVTGRSPW